MDHRDHVNLIRKGITTGGVWADLGSGHGAFTLALAECAGTHSTIYSVDKNRNALDIQKQQMTRQFPDNTVKYRVADFTQPLDLPELDGVVMANSLHFVQDKDPVLVQILNLLKSEGSLVIVEYDTDRPNAYVPYPFSYPTWEKLATANGFMDTQQIAKRPSRNMGRIYAALSRKD